MPPGLPPQPPPPATWHARLAHAAKADPKKATVLATLVVVMVVMWARLLGAGSPSAASAAQTGARAAGALLPSGPQPRLTGPRAAAQQARQEWAAKPLAPLNRNVFAINYDFFPQDTSKAPILRAPQGDGFWDQLAKSMTARADQRREHDVLVENLRLQAAQLKIQSTMMGPRPRALINGEMVGIGDTVSTFRIDRIEARRIVVEREGIKLEVRF